MFIVWVNIIIIDIYLFILGINKFKYFREGLDLDVYEYFVKIF